MRSRRSLRFARRNHQGVALIIVLAMVVLVTGVIIAFFSRSISERQVSNSSSSQTRVDLFTQGASNTIISDLQEEIVGGSTASSPATNVTVYLPTSRATMVPYQVGTGNSTSSSPLPNLVKRSDYGQPFYSTSYNTTPSNRAANALSTTPSLNGRAVSLARWNKPLLLPKAPGTVSTTTTTPISSFTAPSWVLVARDGSNPAVASLTSSMQSSAGTAPTASAVVGRYAYTIYNEGGLLDVNAAGYPTVSGSYPSSNPTSFPVQPTRKSVLSYADLTIPFKLSSSATQANLLTPAQMNALVGWRNYASSQPSGSFPNYTPAATASPSNLSPFDLATLASTKGFLSVGNAALYPSTSSSGAGQSDRMFGSRQQLLDFLVQSVSTTTTDMASLQNAMQYLGTFSRGIEQPSVVPANTVTGTPLTAVLASGGNDSNGGDKVINPSYLSDPTVRVQATVAGGRNDGSDLALGEPLVKKRFALNYLAWLTYRGPSSLRNVTSPQASGADADIYGLENTYGIPATFLQLGTDDGTRATNIPKYFGITWDSSNHLWKYMAYQTGTSGSILTLAQVASAGREPNFFELLKSAITVGSLGKAYSYSSSADGTTPAGYQQLLDNSVDAQVIQIGANIIDQFDLDGYPTRISFNNGLMGAAQEYHGVEDLPYLYRVREGKIMITDSTPSQATLPLAGATVTAAGSGVVLQEPEIWNPHAWSSTVSDVYPRPTSFQLLAASAIPSGTTATIQPGVQWRFEAGTNATMSAASGAAAVNATLTFQIPSGREDLFREPTLLIKPNVPTGSLLGGGTAIASLYKALQYDANGVSDSKSYLGIVLGTVPMAWSGTIPVGGIDGTNPTTATTGAIPAGYVYYPTSPAGLTYRMQYTDYWGSFQTYDLKFAPVANATSYNIPTVSGGASNRTFGLGSGTFMSVDASNIIGSEMSVMCFDPRTARFGMNFAGPNGRGSMALSFPLGSSVGYNEDSRNTVNRFGWAGAPATAANATMTASAKQNALMTTRPDEYLGMVFSNLSNANYFGINSGPTAGGWLPSGTTAIVSPGLFAQNNPDTATATSGLRYATDGSAPATTAAQYFADADTVVRRGMSAYVPTNSTTPATAPTFGLPSGLPSKPAYSYTNSTAAPNSTNDIYSRPTMLNRPFQSPAELGYVFSGTPWRNLDFSTPESGFAPLLDTFCVNVNTNPTSMTAGKVDLNTRQTTVLQAVLSGAYRDNFAPGSSALSTGTPLTGGATGDAKNIAAILLARTISAATGMGPLQNVSELVGQWNSSTATGTSVDGHKSYVGFVNDWATSSSISDTDKRLQSFREAPIRPLAAVGQTRVWNLLIDVIAQTGRYPASATSLDQFSVEGEQRCWLHVAIDRYTGQVIDKQVEVVKE